MYVCVWYRFLVRRVNLFVFCAFRWIDGIGSLYHVVLAGLCVLSRTDVFLGTSFSMLVGALGLGRGEGGVSEFCFLRWHSS